ncbi:MAG: TlpA disulfide reductase family protein [Balneolaceae bacterium]
MSKEKPEKKSSLKKELSQWGFSLGIIAILYATGLHTEVIGRLQSVLLFSGILQPDTELAEGLKKDAYFDMPMVSLGGEYSSLEEFQGKTIFLNFWATWCPPCIAEMPNIQDLYDDISSEQNIQFVMLSLDEDPQNVQDFIHRKGFTFPVFILNGRKPGVYNSSVVPTTYVISPEGEIVMEHAGMAKYNTESFKAFLLGVSSMEAPVDSF